MLLALWTSILPSLLERSCTHHIKLIHISTIISNNMTQSIQTFFRWYILSINLDNDLLFTITTYAMISHTSRIDLTHLHSSNMSTYETCTSLRRGKPHSIYISWQGHPKGHLYVSHKCVYLSQLWQGHPKGHLCVSLSVPRAKGSAW